MLLLLGHAGPSDMTHLENMSFAETAVGFGICCIVLPLMITAAVIGFIVVAPYSLMRALVKKS